MEPQATPYDITEIPYFAYEPGLVAWLSLGLVSILGVALYFYISKKTGITSTLSAIKITKKELQKLIGQNKQLTKPEIEETTLITKRFLSSHYSKDYSSYGQSELENEAKDSEVSALKNALSTLAELSAMAYQPDDFTLSANQTLSPIFTLLEELEMEAEK